MVDFLLFKFLERCRYRDGYLEVGSRTDSRVSFLCLSKEKKPKEKTPHAALILRSEGFERQQGRKTTLLSAYEQLFMVPELYKKSRSEQIAEGTLLNPLHTARASQLLSRSARRGAAGMPRVFRRAGKPIRKTLDKSEKRRKLRYVGGLFFGYFLLATQKKVSRLSVREPTSKWLRVALLI
jgi:hypothetical protein